MVFAGMGAGGAESVGPRTMLLLMLLLVSGVSVSVVRGAVGGVARLSVQPLTDESGVIGTVPRVGGVSGRPDVPVAFLWDESVCVMNKGSLVPGTLRCDDAASPVVCGDTFYFHSAVALLYFGLKDDGEGVSSLGLGAGSDIWEEFSWVEYCPSEGSLYLHVETLPTDKHVHSCGVDHTETFDMLACTTWQGCSGEEAQDGSRVVVFNGTHRGTYTEYRHEAPLSSTPDLIANSLLVLYLYWVTDRAKDLNDRATRQPLVVGNIVALLAIFNAHYNMDLEHRLYHDVPPTRGWHHELSMSIHVTLSLLCVFLHGYVYFGPRNLYHGVHVAVIYETVLLFPLILILSMGGPDERMPMLLVFVAVMVGVGSRIRDIVTVIDAYATTDRRRLLLVDVLVFALDFLVIVFFFAFTSVVVWHPMMINVLMIKTAGTIASVVTFTVFVVGVFLFVQHHRLYSYEPGRFIQSAAQ